MCVLPWLNLTDYGAAQGWEWFNRCCAGGYIPLLDWGAFCSPHDIDRQCLAVDVGVPPVVLPFRRATLTGLGRGGAKCEETNKTSRCQSRQIVKH